MNLSDAPLAMRHRVLSNLSLRRAEVLRWAHCLPDGRWVESDQAPDGDGKVSHVTPLGDGPELRRLISYSTGFECLGFFETVAAESEYSQVKELGSREIAYPADRGFGAYSTRKLTMSEPVTLTRGHRKVTVKASGEKPIAARSIASVLCGRKMPAGYIPKGFIA